MNAPSLLEKAETHLQALCLDMPDRSVGRPSNRKATDYFNQIVSGFGFRTELQTFDCMEWYPAAVLLQAGGRPFSAHPSPYSLGCNLEAELVIASTIGELEAVEASGKILLLYGELTREQLMAKNFVFYNPDEHKQIYRLLEAKAPAAIITATGKNPELAGSMYPFPMLEDGDFDIPSVYMKDIDGDELKAFAGQRVALQFDSQRIPSTGCNVIARKGRDFSNRIVVCAHIDAKENTPGALDNGTGVVCLLLLAELLTDYQAERGVEILAINGEDYFAASGQMKYLETHAGTMDQIGLVVNLDGAGLREFPTAYSFYNMPEALQNKLAAVFSTNAEFKPGDIWYQGDHMVFAMNGCPAVAITTEDFKNICANITHTPNDKPELVDYAKLTAIAQMLKNIVENT